MAFCEKKCRKCVPTLCPKKSYHDLLQNNGQYMKLIVLKIGYKKMHQSWHQSNLKKASSVVTCRSWHGGSDDDLAALDCVTDVLCEQAHEDLHLQQTTSSVIVIHVTWS